MHYSIVIAVKFTEFSGAPAELFLCHCDTLTVIVNIGIADFDDLLNRAGKYSETGIWYIPTIKRQYSLAEVLNRLPEKNGQLQIPAR